MYDSQKSSLDGVVRAKFVLKEGASVKQFQGALTRMFNGEGDDEDVQYVLSNVKDTICGHAGRHGGKSNE